MYRIKTTKASDIAEIVKGKLIGIDSTVDFISIDTRECYENNVCYIALIGEKFDGNEFVTEAINKGCSLIISDKPISCEVPLIKVEDSKRAFGDISKKLSNRAKIVGITGSVGKTTVKEMISSILAISHSLVRPNSLFWLSLMSRCSSSILSSFIFARLSKSRWRMSKDHLR